MQNKRFNVLIGVIAFGIFSMYLAQPLTPNFLTGVHGLSLSQVGLIFTTGAVGNSLMTIVFSRVQPRRGFILSQGLVILFALIVWQATSLPVFALGYFLLGGFRLGRPMAMAQAKSSSAVLRACNVIDRNNSSAPAVVCRRPDKEVKQAFAFIRGSSLRLLIAALRMKKPAESKENPSPEAFLYSSREPIHPSIAPVRTFSRS